MTRSTLNIEIPRTAATARNHPLPNWPAHLPTPRAEFGISEDGATRLDLMLRTGERAVYMQARDLDIYDDIDDDPAWASEKPETRQAVIAYGTALLERYKEVWAEALRTDHGRALTRAVHAHLADM